MAMDSNKKLENQPLTEYRSKVEGTRRFMNRFFMPDWLQTPSKAYLILSLIFWAVGLGFGLYVTYAFPSESDNNSHFFINLLIVTSTISMAGMSFSYYKGQKRKS